MISMRVVYRHFLRRHYHLVRPFVLAGCMSILALAPVCLGQEKPLSKGQLQRLVDAGVNTERLVKVVEQRGIDFRPSGEFIAALDQQGDQRPLVKLLCEIALKNGDEPLDQTLLSQEVSAGVDNDVLAAAVLKRGITFQPTKQYLDSLESAGATGVLLRTIRDLNPKPLTEDQVLALVAQGVPNGRVATLVTLRGIEKKPSEEYLESLRIAGADATLLDALRKVRFTSGKIVVKTKLGARVYLDGVDIGVTGSDGTLRVDSASPGEHLIRVTFDRKSNQTRSILVTGGETTAVELAF